MLCYFFQGGTLDIELMEFDLHQVIKTHDDLTKEHYQFFLYKFTSSIKVYTHYKGISQRLETREYVLAKL